MDIASILLQALKARQERRRQGSADANAFNRQQQATFALKQRGRMADDRNQNAADMAFAKMGNQKDIAEMRDRGATGRVKLREELVRGRPTPPMKDRVMRFPQGSNVMMPNAYDYESQSPMPGYGNSQMPVESAPPGYFGANTKVVMTPGKKPAKSSADEEYKKAISVLSNPEKSRNLQPGMYNKYVNMANERGYNFSRYDQEE